MYDIFISKSHDVIGKANGMRRSATVRISLISLRPEFPSKIDKVQHLVDMSSSKNIFFDGSVEAGISLAIREDKIFACFVRG